MILNIPARENSMDIIGLGRLEIFRRVKIRWNFLSSCCLQQLLADLLPVQYNLIFNT